MWMKLKIILFFLFVGNINPMFSNKLFAFEKLQNKISTSKLLKTVTTLDISDCLVHCIGDINCESFFFKELTSECQLHSVNFFDAKALSNANGWKYYIVYTDLCRSYISQGFAESRVQGFCYKLYLMPQIDLFTYKSECEGEGGELMRIDSHVKHDYMARILETVDSRFNYINGNDLATEGIWLYDDGTPLLYTNWDPSDPNGGTSENYLMMYGLSATYQWHDIWPAHNNRNGVVVCQKIL